jgi:GDPmannose 4,6-dehydratase
VLATGVGYSIRDFLEASFGHVGLEWQKYVKFDERYLRPTEVDALIGDPSKALDKLGWKPTVDGLELAKLMVDADVISLEKEGTPWIDTVNLESWSSK